MVRADATHASVAAEFMGQLYRGMHGLHPTGTRFRPNATGRHDMANPRSPVEATLQARFPSSTRNKGLGHRRPLTLGGKPCGKASAVCSRVL